MPHRGFAGGHKGRSHGFDLHAGRPIGAKRKDRREQLCRDLLRPALSADRLHLTPDGQVLLAIKTPWSDGTTHLELSPMDLIARLAALVCRARADQILHLGVLSPHHRWRAALIPEPLAPSATCALAHEDGCDTTGEDRRRPPPNDSWATLMQRGLQIDTLACPSCGGRFRHIANIMTRDVIRRVLRHLGLQSETADLEPATVPDQPNLFP